MLVCDLLSRELFTYEVPIGIVSSLFGIPIFLAVLLRRRA
ncbi:iron chelate uptake ABC transporter family permease subunit [Campylobacter hyointestinalis]|nr:iron chelate uptake ABC transporter family permease subunit [Campylobacter hyointestinalis]